MILHMRLNYILLPVLCYVKWQLFQSCVFCCILPSSFQREIKKKKIFLLRRGVVFFFCLFVLFPKTKDRQQIIYLLPKPIKSQQYNQKCFHYYADVNNMSL